MCGWIWSYNNLQFPSLFPVQNITVLAPANTAFEAIPADVVLAATPIDITRVLSISKPVVRVRYELEPGSEKLWVLGGAGEPPHRPRNRSGQIDRRQHRDGQHLLPHGSSSRRIYAPQCASKAGGA